MSKRRPGVTSNAELLELVRKLRDDPCRDEAFEVISKLSREAGNASPQRDVFYTYNKLLWLMGL